MRLVKLICSAAMRNVAVFVLLLIACSSSSKSPAAPVASEGSGTSAGSAAGCPAPRATTDVCAAVMTYAKAADGTCCAYPSPCAVPIEGQQYSDDKCTTAMGPAH